MNIFEINIRPVTKREIQDILMGFATGDRIRSVFYLNAHCANIASKDEAYKSVLNKADLVHADGQGVVWASRFLGFPLPERVNIMDFFDEFTKKLVDKKISIYLLGGDADVVKKAGEVLEKKGMNIIGLRCGFFDDIEESRIIQDINALGPDILMVGMDTPKQEKWIFKHICELNVRLCWAVGNAFELMAGTRKRTPKWMAEHGLEWLCRLCQRPDRLWKRYLFGNFVFIYNVFKYKLKRRC
jgi:N-acetylglucosaminyldiphosphoundecaprenol N-acetyl-beta-D-mannosaminyltransferase